MNHTHTRTHGKMKKSSIILAKSYNRLRLIGGHNRFNRPIISINNRYHWCPVVQFARDFYRGRRSASFCSPLTPNFSKIMLQIFLFRPRFFVSFGSVSKFRFRVIASRREVFQIFLPPFFFPKFRAAFWCGRFYIVRFCFEIPVSRYRAQTWDISKFRNFSFLSPPFFPLKVRHAFWCGRRRRSNRGFFAADMMARGMRVRNLRYVIENFSPASPLRLRTVFTKKTTFPCQFAPGDGLVQLTGAPKIEFGGQNLNPVKIGAAAVVENSCICAVVYVKRALVCVSAFQFLLVSQSTIYPLLLHNHSI